MDYIATEERNQARARLAISTVAGIFLLTLSLTPTEIRPDALSLAWGAFVLHFAYSLGVFYWLHIHPQPLPKSRSLSITPRISVFLCTD